MYATVGIVVAVIDWIVMVVQWGFGWRYLLSASFRRSVQQQLRRKSRLARFGEAVLVAIGFLVVNGIIVAILWRVFIGPIKPVHEW